jgi:hypothetical protein
VDSAQPRDIGNRFDIKNQNRDHLRVQAPALF